MKNRIFVILLVLFIKNLLIFSQNDVLTDEILISSKWGPEQEAGRYLTFFKGFKYEYAHKSIGMDGWSGTYTLENGKLTIFDELKNGILVYDKNSTMYKCYIIFDNGIKIYKLDSNIKKGEKININSIDSISTGIINSKTKDNLKMREAPDINSKSLTFNTMYSIGDEKSYPYIPKDTKIIILARTIIKDKINNWENYWYYIIPDAEGYINNPNRAWVFGEFIDISE